MKLGVFLVHLTCLTTVNTLVIARPGLFAVFQINYVTYRSIVVVLVHYFISIPRWIFMLLSSCCCLHVGISWIFILAGAAACEVVRLERSMREGEV